jgi:phosphocarrier protein HPr
MSETLRRTAKIVNTKGLHARAAAKLCKMADQFNACVTVSKGDLQVSGSSIMGLLMLAAAQGTEVHLETSGADAENAMTALFELIENGFDED